MSSNDADLLPFKSNQFSPILDDEQSAISANIATSIVIEIWHKQVIKEVYVVLVYTNCILYYYIIYVLERCRYATLQN